MIVAAVAVVLIALSACYVLLLISDAVIRRAILKRAKWIVRSGTFRSFVAAPDPAANPVATTRAVPVATGTGLNIRFPKDYSRYNALQLVLVEHAVTNPEIRTAIVEMMSEAEPRQIANPSPPAAEPPSVPPAAGSPA